MLASAHCRLDGRVGQRAGPAWSPPAGVMQYRRGLAWVWTTAPWPAKLRRALATAPADRPSVLAIAVGDSAYPGRSARQPRTSWRSSPAPSRPESGRGWDSVLVALAVGLAAAADGASVS